MLESFYYASITTKVNARFFQVNVLKENITQPFKQRDCAIVLESLIATLAINGAIRITGQNLLKIICRKFVHLTKYLKYEEC